MIENFYAVPEIVNGKAMPLKKVHEMVIPEGTTAYINDGIGLHAMGSASGNEHAYSLHLYSPPYSSVKCYEEDGSLEDRSVFFHTKYGERV